MNLVKPLIQDAMDKLGMSESQLARQMGYQNVNRGLRRLRQCIENGSCAHDLTEKLSVALNIPQNDLASAARETRLARKQRKGIEGEKRAQLAFRPHIVLSVDRRPTPLFVWLALEREWRVDIPQELRSLPYDEELSAVRELYLDRFYEAGGVVFNSEITGFMYYRSPGETLVFDATGRFYWDRTIVARQGKLTFQGHSTVRLFRA